METPGAKISRALPKLEKEALVSELSVAPTVKAVGARAGDEVEASVALFPAATITGTPAETVAATALSREVETPPPKDMETAQGR
jgi:hypothetical protein